MRIVYYHRPSLLGTSDSQVAHQRVCSLFETLRNKGTVCTVEDADKNFPTQADQQAFLDGLNLRDFALRRKVALGRNFGSNRFPFSFLPGQFLLVYNGPKLSEVFPCMVARNEIKPLEYLEEVAVGRPWTTHAGKGMQGKKHRLLVNKILANPDRFEPGLILKGQDVQVSQDGEVGFVDLLFEDRSGQSLLIEVKVEGDELAKAVGQILWHRQLFAEQNGIAKSSIRVAICCQYVPPQFRIVCEDSGIQWFELPLKPHKDEPLTH